jgi:hypothetical protein
MRRYCRPERRAAGQGGTRGNAAELGIARVLDRRRKAVPEQAADTGTKRREP